MKEGKRKITKNSRYSEADIPGYQPTKNLTSRQKVLEKNKEKDREIVGIEEEEKPEVRKNPPPRIFLSRGARQELGWAKSSKTNGMTGDKYKYNNAKNGESQLNIAKGRTEYRCCNCKNFFPLKNERKATDASYITLDHVPAMSVRLDGNSLVITYCDGEDVWQGTGREIAFESYNDPDLLRFMCQSCNSIRGGKKDYFAEPPIIIDEHRDNCPHPHVPNEIKKYGQKDNDNS